MVPGSYAYGMWARLHCARYVTVHKMSKYDI